MTQPSDSDAKSIRAPSSLRAPRAPIIPRKIWILGSNQVRIVRLTEAVEAAGHQVRTAETSGELTPALREFRPDLIVIDMEEHPDRGRHVAMQLRADRATRQLPIVLVGAGPKQPVAAGDKTITGPTRRYRLPMDAPSVVNAILTEL
jgi:CheY-like chemotaxis protein